MLPRSRLFVIPILIGFCGFAGRAQVASAPNPTGSSDAQATGTLLKADTHAVVVDVVVTKGQDEPVLALHKQDFQLTEDGKPQAIDFFEEHTAPASLVGALAPLPKMPPNVYTNVPAAPLSDSVNVLLLDSLNTPRQDQSYVHQQIMAFLKTMKPDVRIAIFTLGSKLRFIQGFTDDPALLQAALNDKNYGVSPETTNVSRTRRDDADDKRDVDAKMEAFGGGAHGGGRGSTTAGVIALTRAQADYVEFQADQRVAMTLDALQNLGRYLAGIPGRKNLIWFASSYPIYFFPKSLEKQPFNNHGEYTSEIKETADILTLSKVAVYPISAEGMMNDHGPEADNWKKPGMADFQAEAGDRAAKMFAMEQLASDTGGEAIFNSNDLNNALNHVIHNGDHYYTIVYTPTNKELNGQFRVIKIKLDQGKYKLSYRRGYYADDQVGQHGASNKISKVSVDALRADGPGADGPDAESKPLQPLLRRGMPSATQILYGIRVAPSSAQPASGAKRAGANAQLTGPTTRYTADFLIDWKMVKLEATSDGNHAGKIRVELLAYDHDGKALNWTGSLMNMSINPATYAAIQRSGLPAHLEIDVPSNVEVYLATGVYDLETSRAGTLEVPLDAHANATAMAAQTEPKNN
jgi:VWFA-related protein